MAVSILRSSMLALAASATLASASTLKLGFKKERHADVIKRANGYLNAPLSEDVNQSGYYVNISLGTPQQQFTVTLDTGSSDLWVPNARACASQELQAGCEMGGIYHADQSTSYMQILNVSVVLPYGIGEAEGFLSSDNLHIEGTEIQNFSFYDIERVIDQSGIGILGVGYDNGQLLGTEVGTNYEYPSLVDALVSQGVINRKAYSLYLDDQEEMMGSIIFGGIDSSKYSGDLISLPVQPNGTGQYDRWAIDLTAVTLTDANGNANPLSPSGMATRVTLDSGSTLSYLPMSITNQILSGLGAIAIQGAGISVADCAFRNSKATLDFTFGGSGGATIKVGMAQLLGDFFPGDTFGNGVAACTVNLASQPELESEELETLILGDSFLRSAYAVYDIDNNEISLAQAKFNQTGTSNIQAIPSGSGLPGVSSTATGVASTFPFPSSGVMSSTGVPESGAAATSVSIPASASSATFSLGVTAPTSGNAQQASATGGGGSMSSGAAGAIMHTEVSRMTTFVSIIAGAVLFAGMLIL